MLLAFGIAVHILFLISLATGWLDPLAHDPRHIRQHGADLFAVYSAGANLLQGESIYSPPADKSIPYRYAYRYTPLGAAVVGLPLSMLSPCAAYAVWTGFLEALLAWYLVAIWKRNRARRSTLAVIGLSLAFYPYYLELYMGQYSWLQAILFFLTCIGLAERDRLRAGIAYAASLAWKGNTLLLAPALLRGRKYLLLIVPLAAVIVLSAPYFAYKPQALAEYGRNFSSDYPAGFTRGNLGLLRFADRLLDHTTSPVATGEAASTAHASSVDAGFVSPQSRGLTLTLIAAAIGIAALAVTVFTKPDRLIQLCCLWMAVYFLVYKHVWEHQYVMLLPVLALAALERPSRLLWAAWIWLALPTPYAWIEPAIVHGRPLELIYYGWKAVPAIIVCVILARNCLERRTA